MKSKAIFLLPLWAFVVCSRVNFTFTFIPCLTRNTPHTICEYNLVNKFRLIFFIYSGNNWKLAYNNNNKYRVFNFKLCGLYYEGSIHIVEFSRDLLTSESKSKILCCCMSTLSCLWDRQFYLIASRYSPGIYRVIRGMCLYFGRWQYRSLWEKTFLWTWV